MQFNFNQLYTYLHKNKKLKVKCNSPAAYLTFRRGISHKHTEFNSIAGRSADLRYEYNLAAEIASVILVPYTPAMFEIIEDSDEKKHRAPVRTGMEKNSKE